MTYLWHAIPIGIGATLVMDLWGTLRRPLFGLAPLDLRLLGRWIGHMARGRFRHAAINAAPQVPAEQAIGLVAHYTIGIVFAGFLLLITGPSWLRSPTPIAPILVGVGTVLAPLLLMQPGMGGGVAAARMPRPWRARLQSLISHAVYGIGLYLAALATLPLRTP